MGHMRNAGVENKFTFKELHLNNIPKLVTDPIDRSVVIYHYCAFFIIMQSDYGCIE